nr:transposase [Jiangella anatolica]
MGADRAAAALERWPAWAPVLGHRRVVEGIIYRYRTGIAWRDLPREPFGSWKTVWKRHRRYAEDGTWDKVLAGLLAQADAAGQIDWTVSVDATINRAHQHATNTTRPEQDNGGHGRTTRICLRGSSPARSAGNVNLQATVSESRVAG